DERVRELDSPPDPEQPGVQCRAGRRHRELESLGRAVEQQRVAQRLCGRDQNEQPRVRRQLIEAMRIALFDLARYRLAVGQPEATGELGGAPGARQVEEGERIAVALGG